MATCLFPLSRTVSKSMVMSWKKNKPTNIRKLSNTVPHRTVIAPTIFNGHQINCTENLLSNSNYYLKSNYIKIHLSTNFDRLWLLTLTPIKCSRWIKMQKITAKSRKAEKKTEFFLRKRCIKFYAKGEKQIKRKNTLKQQQQRRTSPNKSRKLSF